MQWGVLAFWGLFSAALTRIKRGGAILCACLVGAMAAQLALLRADGLLTLGSALPLHLCSFSAMLCLPMLLQRRVGFLLSWMLLLGAPCALLALAFPAVASCSRPLAMRLAFYSLHALILCAAVFRLRLTRELPRCPRETLLALNGLAALASVANRSIGSNYLFLRVPPVGTPLEGLAADGFVPYLLRLELLAMLLLFGLDELSALLWQRLQKARPSAIRPRTR